jgi:hypothetical protein
MDEWNVRNAANIGMRVILLALQYGCLPVIVIPAEIAQNRSNTANSILRHLGVSIVL